MGQLRGQTAEVIIDRLEDCGDRVSVADQRGGALATALSCIAQVRKGCISSRTCVFCVVKVLLQQDGDEVDAIAEAIAGEEEDQSKYGDDMDWDRIASKASKDSDGWLAVCAARHNKEQHASNGNIFYAVDGAGAAVLDGLIKVADEYPVIRQPDSADAAEGRLIQEL